VNITAPMVLPKDVTIVPVSQLPEAIRATFADGDFAVTRRRSRAATTIVDAHAAVLLERFRHPTPIVHAVIAFSRAEGVPATKVLDDAFPLLKKLLDARVMLPAGTADADVIEATLIAGANVGPFTVQACVQVLDDVELYRARCDGVDVALKLLRPTSPNAGGLAHEAAVLRLLDGQPAPRLVADESGGDPAYIALDWIESADAARAAAERRRLPADERAGALLELSRSILRAYVALHERGVVHGDVHPNNVLVDSGGGVTLIDFGLARVEHRNWEGSAPGRGGVGFFFEPEFARAQRSGAPPPQATQAGEQFAIGALLYLLLTGSHYTDLSIERDELARQIETVPPERFIRRGIEPWPCVEQALGRALSKKPGDRFSSVAELAAVFDAATVPVWACKRSMPGRADPARSVLEDVLQRLLPAPTAASQQRLQPPTCSISYGAAGMAYALYRMSALREHPELLCAADVWAERAARTSVTDGAFANAEFEITPEVTGMVSPYHSSTGVAMTQALIAAARADPAAHQAAQDDFVTGSRQACDAIDLTLGRCGTVVASALLLEGIRQDTALADEQREPLLALGRETLDAVWIELGDCSVGGAGGPDYLGIAHGWAGILYATILWCQTAGDVWPARARERLGELAAREGGSGGWWPLSDGAGQASAMPGWCHGSAGYTHLWALAAEALGDSDYSATALRAADWATKSGEGIGSLCCGLAGRAYAALTAYRHSGEREWLQRAFELANGAADGLSYWACPQGSLYKGDLGVALLAAELERPERAAMPVFQVA
jgi:serine/threonine protein kinase